MKKVFNFNLYIVLFAFLAQLCNGAAAGKVCDKKSVDRDLYKQLLQRNSQKLDIGEKRLDLRLKEIEYKVKLAAYQKVEEQQNNYLQQRKEFVAQPESEEKNKVLLKMSADFKALSESKLVLADQLHALVTMKSFLSQRLELAKKGLCSFDEIIEEIEVVKEDILISEKEEAWLKHSFAQAKRNKDQSGIDYFYENIFKVTAKKFYLMKQVSQLESDLEQEKSVNLCSRMILASQAELPPKYRKKS